MTGKPLAIFSGFPCAMGTLRHLWPFSVVKFSGRSSGSTVFIFRTHSAGRHQERGKTL